MKKSRFVLFIVVFMLVALCGVGFASWLIIAPTSVESAGGNIRVESVESKVSWQFDAKWVEGPSSDVEVADPIIVFGTPATKDENIKKVWLTNPSLGKENLTVYLYVKANVDEGKIAVNENEFANISINVVKKTKDGDGKETVEKADFNTHLEGMASVKITEAVKGEVISKITYEQLRDGVFLKITFNWKDFTDDGTGDNPFNYFNLMEYSDANKKAANDYLNGLFGKLAGCTFEVLLSAEPGA